MASLRAGRRRAVFLLAGICVSIAGGVAAEEQAQAPRIGRYRVWINGTWQRNLVIEDAGAYAVYEQPGGALYGRGTYTFDGTYARFPTGPFNTLGWWGRSFVRPDGKHSIRLSRYAEAISEQ
jgi:hypothetical protein